jgi:DNA-binding response OmpR family regulator
MNAQLPRILIVEDAEEISASLAEFLGDEGFEVACAPTGRAGLHLLRAAAAIPDLILLDFMLPDMDGRQFRREQAQDPRLAGIPILLMTAGGDIEQKARDLDARGYLKKPFSDLDAFLEMIRRSLSAADRSVGT